jgi:hypothetical protein
MKKLGTLLLLICSIVAISQEKSSYIQADYFYGNVLGLNPDGLIFLEGHPKGFFISYNQRTTAL